MGSYVSRSQTNLNKKTNFHYFKEKFFSIYIANPSDNTKNRTQLIERFHRTFRQKLRKIFIKEDTLRWIDYLDDIIKNYNNQIHSYIRMKPIDVFKYKKKPQSLPYLKPS